MKTGKSLTHIKKIDDSGFTLMELIITVAILSVLMTGVVTTFPQWLRQYTMLKETSRATEIMDILASGINQEMKFSTSRTWGSEGISYVNAEKLSTSLPIATDGCTITYESDKLIIDGRPKIYGSVFDTGIYDEMTVRLILSETERTRDNARVLQTLIEVYSDSGALLATETKSTMYYNP